MIARVPKLYNNEWRPVSFLDIYRYQQHTICLFNMNDFNQLSFQGQFKCWKPDLEKKIGHRDQVNSFKIPFRTRGGCKIIETYNYKNIFINNKRTCMTRKKRGFYNQWRTKAGGCLGRDTPDLRIFQEFFRFLYKFLSSQKFLWKLLENFLIFSKPKNFSQNFFLNFFVLRIYF